MAVMNHHVDPVTRELIGATPAREDPRHPGRFLQPAHATHDPAPPPEAGKARVFDRERRQWTKVEDHRGKEMFDADDRPVRIDRLGPLPEGVSTTRRGGGRQP